SCHESKAGLGRGRQVAGECVTHRGDVCRSRPAATTDEAHAGLDEAARVLTEVLWRRAIEKAVFEAVWQAGGGPGREENIAPPVPDQLADGGGHLADRV